MKRLALVVVVALVGFGAAFLAFGDEARRGCVVEAPRDPSYSAEFEDPVPMGQGVHVLRVSRDGRPVTGARVCLTVDMVGMSAMGAGEEAREVAPGRYEVSLNLPMAGQWRGTVLVEEQGTTQEVAVPLTFEVTTGHMP
ncbi:MAG: FixH family protein [Actinomycetota bacterium]|nr:FixH family protein [Actinomycetota bacterium]